MKRVFCLILALVMVWTIAGCTSSQTTEPESAPTASSESQNSTAASENTVSQDATSDLEFVKLKMIALGDGSADSERMLTLLNEKLKADLNCELEIEYISWSDWTTKYPLVFASGEEFDLIYTSSWASYASQATKGAFYELTESDRQTYMPLTCAALGEDGWKQAAIDGKVYMVPTTPQGAFVDKTCFGVRGDLMEEFGMASITTAEDMLAYWDNVLEMHPEMVPINITNTSSGAFGAYLARLFIDDTYSMTSPNYFPQMTSEYSSSLMPTILDLTDRTNIQYVDQADADQYFITIFEKAAELQKKGYWTSDALTITEEMDVAYKNGKSASTFRELGNIEAYNQDILANHPEWAPTIVRFVDKPYVSIPGLNNGMAVHATSKNPERAMMVLDLMGYDQSYYDLMHYGEESVDFSIDESGAVSKITAFSEASSMGFANVTERVVATATDVYVTMRAEAVGNSMLPEASIFTFDHSVCETEYAAMSQVMSKYFPILSLGMAEDVEAVYNEMMAELGNAGMDVVMDEYLRQAQTFFGVQ